MERNEMIETLMRKANVSREEATEVLEICNWDLLDSIIYLERRGKVENNETTAIIEVEEVKQEDDKKHHDSFGGIGEIIGRVFKFIGRTLKKSGNHYFEIRKENKKPIRVSLLISIILGVLFSVPALILLVVGLFCGYKYSIVGPKGGCDTVNNIFDEVSKSAETIKRDFKEGYNN